jgi:hypothetical protein
LVDGKEFSKLIDDNIFVMLKLKNEGLIGGGKDFEHLGFGLESDGSKMLV